MTPEQEAAIDATPLTRDVQEVVRTVDRLEGVLARHTGIGEGLSKKLERDPLKVPTGLPHGAGTQKGD